VVFEGHLPESDYKFKTIITTLQNFSFVRYLSSLLVSGTQPFGRKFYCPGSKSLLCICWVPSRMFHRVALLYVQVMYSAFTEANRRVQATHKALSETAKKELIIEL